MSDSTHEDKSAESATTPDPAQDLTGPQPADWQTRTVAFNAELLELCKKYELQISATPEIKEGLIVASVRAFDMHKAPDTSATGAAAMGDPSETTPATPAA